ncbi:MAG: cytochrome c biogenesis protein CcsA [Myxococcales bacterium]|nr:cytochrome c biogenesis protein CcsA [Myxococcales bacterium]
MYYLLAALTAVGFLVCPYLVFHNAPIEPQMGFIQKIFYFHVPCAWQMLFGAITCGIGGAVFLFKRKPWADRLTTAASELTVVFGALVMTSGPLWARKAWGHYWVWDARLTSLLILFLTFLGVMLARRYAGPAGRRIAAGAALFGAINVPLVYVSVRIWKTNHPSNTVVTTLSPAMRLAFWLSVLTFTLLFVLMMWTRMRTGRLEDEVDELAIAIADRGPAAPRKRDAKAPEEE